MHIIQDPTFLHLVEHAKVLCTKRGLNRIYLLENNLIMKVIYGRRRYSTAKRLASTFVKNTKKLKAKQIPCVSVKKLEHYPKYSSVVIYYDFIPMKSILTCFSETGETLPILKSMDILAQLHRRNIFFSDFNPGNVLIDESGNFCLIDVQSVFFLFFLPFRKIIKNFVAFFECLIETCPVSEELVQEAAQHYFKAMNYSTRKQHKFMSAISTLTTKLQSA